MESAIESVWNDLYTNNSKIQAFAVVRNASVIWQTANWNPAAEIGAIMSSVNHASPTLSLGGMTYNRTSSDSDSYIASAGNNGHVLITRMQSDLWMLAWAASNADPDLSLIDLKKAAIDLLKKI